MRNRVEQEYLSKDNVYKAIFCNDKVIHYADESLERIVAQTLLAIQDCIREMSPDITAYK